MDSTLVATSYADLWDGTLNAPINVNEAGNAVGIEVVQYDIWTGTSEDGSAVSGQTLGAPFRVILGSPLSRDISGGKWMLYDEGDARINSLPLYGISSTLTVPALVAATPEPSSLLSFITLGGLMLGGALRGAKK